VSGALWTWAEDLVNLWYDFSDARYAATSWLSPQMWRDGSPTGWSDAKLRQQS
jgi:hypothetical protein